MPDVLVVGAGTAGLPAAISAAQRGARVVLIEAQRRVGGQLWRSSATISAAGTRMQKAKGIDDSPELHIEDCNHIGRGKANQALLALVMRESARAVDWLESIGVPFTDDSPRLAPEHDLYSRPRSHYPGGMVAPEGGRLDFVRALERELQRWQQRGLIDLRPGERLERLVVERGRVVGIATSVGEYRAPVVVLTTGGYHGDLAELRRRHPDKRGLLTMSLPHADGSGLKAAEGIGASSSRFEWLIPTPGWLEDPEHPDQCLWASAGNGRPPALCGDIWVNSRGQRFVAEDCSPDDRERALMKQGDNRMLVIFDAAMLDAAPAVAWTRKNILDTGAFVKADSIGALADALSIPAANLESTIDRYNGFVTRGKDPDFGRQRLPCALEHSPFYGVRTRGVVLSVRGGLDINERLEVLDQQGQPIPGLLAAGEVIGFGLIAGDGVCSGTHVGAAVTLGLIAGRQAAATAVLSAPTPAAP
jgi:fumarate reductase flavoprotein subunit